MKKENEGKVDRTTDIVVLYEDDSVLVINKPSGLMVHEDGRSSEKAVVDWFVARAPEARGVGEPGKAQDGTPLERSGVVHRLDKDTSGVLILAKTQDAFVHLKAQFHDRYAKKEYRAFVYGTMKERWGTVDRAIGRSAKDFRLRSAERGAKGLLRAARTEWECLEQGNGCAYMRLEPKTGRTHQIRVHMKTIGHPVVHDTLYAQKHFLERESLGFARLALHAHMLTLTLPSGNVATFTAPLPPDFERALEAIATQ
jgi:23S rRNA pseudouridine1911/1915/1917 synthase